ncbi:CDK-activating kinase assembly factor MAT1 isoform X2 [Dermochelys coriacea]|uniref:CDK-activating kinase assembly factor MAT1 isoform X2 n=1 Tax=Dermochelys coriacea TaxID=27794 RepID=UPI001CA805EF|nr:CDK-activating kinase assembly factor MAT1 isoform X2 [Dermochelys coriacea]
MDDQGCPRCKTTKYRNPSLKLMVNVCGHTLDPIVGTQASRPRNTPDVTAKRTRSGLRGRKGVEWDKYPGYFQAAPFPACTVTPIIDKLPKDTCLLSLQRLIIGLFAPGIRCESCVELLFVRGAGNCQECDTPLRKSNFRVQLFEDPAIDKEVEIRKKVLKVYNKREDDFPSLTEYNDFLEEVEEIVFNLTNNVDLDNTKKKMDNYQKDNKEVIQKNKIKLTREQEELEEALEVERQENEQRRLFIQKEEQMQQIIKRKNKQALLDELESSHLPASLLLAQHKDRSTQLEMQLEKPRPVKPVTFSTGIKMTQHISLAPIQKLEEALYEYQPLRVETYGPQVPETELLGRLGCQCSSFSSAVVLCGAGHARNLGSCKNTVKSPRNR